MKIRIGGALFVLILIAVTFSGCVEQQVTTPTTTSVSTSTPTPSATEKIEYQLVKVDDISYLNAVRLQARVVVPMGITEQGIKDVSQDIVDEITASKEVNAIAILMYDRAEDVNDVYTVASVDWAPYGDWAKASEAKTGEYAKHQFSYNIKEKVQTTAGRPTDREFEIYDIYDKALWEDPDVPEDVVRAKVAKQLGISEEELDEIYIKVVAWKYT